MANQPKNLFSGYDGIYQWVCHNLAAADLAESAPHLGLVSQPEGSVLVRFLARDYRVTRSGVEPLDGLPAGVHTLSLVGQYALSRGRGEPSGEFRPLGRMTGLVESRQGLAGDSFCRPLERAFGSDLPALRDAAARLEGTPLLHPPSGGWGWLFHPFPKIPLQLIFHEADEEFPAEFRLLFDRAAVHFLDFEALGFLTGVFVKEMTLAAEAGGKTSAGNCPS